MVFYEELISLDVCLHSFFPKNPLIRKGKNVNEELTPKQKEFVEFLEKASNQSKEKKDA